MGQFKSITPFNLPEDFFVGGYVYVRVFNAQNPEVGTEYGDSTLFGPLADQDPDIGSSPGPDEADMTGGWGGTFQLTEVIIPEPTSFALLILGLGAFFKKKIFIP